MTHALRNVFDQYSQAENRLTHALATCLSREPRLLGRFLAGFGPKAVAKGAGGYFERGPINVRQLALCSKGVKGRPRGLEPDSRQPYPISR